MHISTDTLLAASRVVSAVYEAIKEMGPNGMPSGHLYAALMPVMSLEDYTDMISFMKHRGLIRESAHVLFAV